MIELIEIFIRPLERHGLPYVITGSVASMAYGEPRLTNDIDLILDLGDNDVDALLQAFPEVGYYLPPADIIHSERIRLQRGHFNIIHQDSMLKADVYLIGADPLHRWAFQHSRQLEIDGASVTFAPPEYVIIRKLEFFKEGGSEKHLRDVASILMEAAADMDTAFIEQESHTRGLSIAWQSANRLAQS